MASETFAERVLWLCRETGIGRNPNAIWKTLSQQGHIKTERRSVYNQLKAKDLRGRIELMLGLHSATGVSLDWLASGNGSPFPDQPPPSLIPAPVLRGLRRHGIDPKLAKAAAIGARATALETGLADDVFVTDLALQLARWVAGSEEAASHPNPTVPQLGPPSKR